MADYGSGYDAEIEKRDQAKSTSKSLLDNRPIFEWDQIQGNPFNEKLSISMVLAEEGYISLKKAQPKGMPRSGEYWAKVRYGKEYVFAYIANFLLKTIDNDGKRRSIIENLLKEALDAYYEGALTQHEEEESKAQKTEKEWARLAGIDPEKPQSEWNRTEKRAFLTIPLQKAGREVTEEMIDQWFRVK